MLGQIIVIMSTLLIIFLLPMVLVLLSDYMYPRARRGATPTHKTKFRLAVKANGNRSRALIFIRRRHTMTSIVTKP